MIGKSVVLSFNGFCNPNGWFASANLEAIRTSRLRAMGIRDKPISPASPWQNGFVERLIGSIWRECLDHIIVLGEAHLRRILKSYASAGLTISEFVGQQARKRARLMARASSRCFFAETAVMRLGTILPRSET